MTGEAGRTGGAGMEYGDDDLVSPMGIAMIRRIHNAIAVGAGVRIARLAERTRQMTEIG